LGFDIAFSIAQNCCRLSASCLLAGSVISELNEIIIPEIIQASQQTDLAIIISKILSG